MMNQENETTCPCNTNQCGCNGKSTDCPCGEDCECSFGCECTEAGCGCKP